tara:strand:+ start:946 stop:1059 length:114 start_codon:yes stop_codon:yes gene_type:complete
MPAITVRGNKIIIFGFKNVNRDIIRLELNISENGCFF